MNVGDIRVLVRWGERGQVDLGVNKKNTLFDLCNSSPVYQDGAAILWSTSDETRSILLKMISQKIKLLLDRRGDKYHKHMP